MDEVDSRGVVEEIHQSVTRHQNKVTLMCTNAYPPSSRSIRCDPAHKIRNKGEVLEYLYHVKGDDLVDLDSLKNGMSKY